MYNKNWMYPFCQLQVLYMSSNKWFPIPVSHIFTTKSAEYALIVDIMHYIDVLMTTIASQITSLTVVYSAVYSDGDQRKHQSSASLAFVRGIHRDRWIPRTNGQ